MFIRRAKVDARLQRWLDLMAAVEAPYAEAVLNEKARYIRASSLDFPSSRVLNEDLFHEHSAAMVAIATHYNGVAIRLGLQEMMNGIKSMPPPRTKQQWDKLWLYLTQKWAAEWGAVRAREAAGTTREDMQRIVQQSLSHDEEFNPQQVAEDLLKTLEISAWRASTIARTETHAAMMYASEEGAAAVARENDISIRKRWVPVRDERTRVNHAGMADHPAIAMDADFLVGGERMARPGDPRGSAANTINCRCVLVFEVIE